MMRTVGLAAPSQSFPVAAFDEVNERVSRRTAEMKAAWHAFASGWNAIVYRLTAAHSHAEQLTQLLKSPRPPSFEERFAQDHELFCWAVAAQSSVECGCFAAQVVALVATGKPFRPRHDSDLRFSPKGVATHLSKHWSNAAITTVVKHAVVSAQFREIDDLRRVLFHRGTLPRMISLQVGGGEIIPDTIPLNPADPADQWRYERKVTPGMVDSKVAWVDETLQELIEALADFTGGW